jgi:hypothetical protein
MLRHLHPTVAWRIPLLPSAAGTGDILDSTQIGWNKKRPKG